MDANRVYEAHAFLSAGDERGRAAPAVALGCPGSPQDGQQMLEELRKELGDRKVREKHLLEIISELRTSHHQMSSGSFGETTFMNAEGASGSPTTESQEEKLKDARINQLQRQVAMLQASLFKAEGKSQRVAEVSKEKDELVENYRKAMENVGAVSLQLNQVQKHNESLQQEVSSLRAANQELISQALRTQQDSEAQTAKLNEELRVAKGELATLKESINRLSQENKSLKESGPHLANGQVSMASTDYNNELDYLHRVVDTLKTTVLEQRNFLVNLKSPQSSQAPPPSQLRTSPTPQPLSNGVGAEPTELHEDSHLVPLTDRQPNGLTAGVSDIPRRPVQAPVPAGISDVSRRPVQAPVSTGISDVSRRPVQAPVSAGISDIPRRPVQAPVPAGISDVPRRPVQAPVPTGISDVSRRLVQTAALTVEETSGASRNGKLPLQGQASVPVRKNSHSEVHARRSSSDAAASKNRAKSDVIARDKGSNLGSEGRKFPQWMFPTTGMGAVQDLTHFQTATPTRPPVVASGLPQFEAAVMSSPIRQPVVYPPHYVDTGTLQTAPSHSNPQPPSPHLTADRLCPVCNKNFGHLSMEEFQTHVFECFDDENAPETMKPSESPVPTTGMSSADRFCPMCNTRFGSNTAQAEYEKHVHSHFGEEGPGDHFEILQP